MTVCGVCIGKCYHILQPRWRHGDDDGPQPLGAEEGREGPPTRFHQPKLSTTELAGRAPGTAYNQPNGSVLLEQLLLAQLQALAVLAAGWLSGLRLGPQSFAARRFRANI